MIINKLLVRQINIHGVGRYNISSLTELFYFSALGKAVRLGRGAVQDDEGAPVHLMMVHLMSMLCGSKTRAGKSVQNVSGCTS